MKKTDYSWFEDSPHVSQLPDSYTVAPNAEQRTFITRDKLTLFAQWWIPQKNQPKAVVLLIHGSLLHSGFYALWADHLVENNYAVLGVDLRGWGQSQGFGHRQQYRKTLQASRPHLFCCMAQRTLLSRYLPVNMCIKT